MGTDFSLLLALNHTGMPVSSTKITVEHGSNAQNRRRASVERQTVTSVEQSVFPFGYRLSRFLPITQCVPVLYLVLLNDLQ